MSDPVITSRDNALLKRARMVRDGKLREHIFIEGLRLCQEAVHSLDVSQILDVICAEDFARNGRGAELLDTLAQIGKSATLVRDSIFDSICDTKTPQGIVILAARPNRGEADLATRHDQIPMIVILCDINNPSNAGAIVRVAEAANATGVILTKGSTDIFSPRALRGAMGSSFRLPIWTDAPLEDAMSFCETHGIRTYGTDLHGDRQHTDVDWKIPCALVVGPEANGLSSAQLARTDESIRIPMRDPVESLNVSIATGILLYEAARQRAGTVRG